MKATAPANPDQDDFLAPDPEVIPTFEIILELERELGIRKTCFPRWIATGKMAKVEGDRRIAIMERILADYTDQLNTEAGPRPF